MKFLELNKKRHATKHFIDKPVDRNLCFQKIRKKGKALLKPRLL